MCVALFLELELEYLMKVINKTLAIISSIVYKLFHVVRPIHRGQGREKREGKMNLKTYWDQPTYCQDKHSLKLCKYKYSPKLCKYKYSLKFCLDKYFLKYCQDEYIIMDINKLPFVPTREQPPTVQPCN